MAEGDNSKSSKAHAHSWAAVVHFAVHALIGLAIFAIIASPAVVLNFVIKFIQSHGASSYIVNVLTFVEYSVITIDALLYLGLLCKSVYKSAKELDL